MIERLCDRAADVSLPWLLKGLTSIPWAAKAWIAERPQVWRFYTGACRRLGWNASRLGWHTSSNGPLAGVRIRALHPNHLWVPVGVYETSVARLAISILAETAGRPDAAEVWDVGAHRGLFSLMCARNGAERVLAIEPSAVNLEALRDHLAANAALGRRIETLHAAISDRDGEIEFVINDTDGAVCQIRADGVAQYDHGSSTSRRTVPAWTLDSLLARRTSPPVLVKIDVEGAEGLVLAGAARLLSEHRPAIFMEVHNASAGRASIDLLTRAGYRSSLVGVNAHLAPIPADLAYGHVLARAGR
jgi:FkbM family methyltransferase